MSRCASGSSSISTCGRRARQAASWTSLRWPPLSSLVGIASASSDTPEIVEQHARLALGAVAALLGPLRQQPLLAAERAAHGVEVGGQRRVGEAALDRVQLGLERGQLRTGGAHPGERRALVAGDVLGQERVDEPAPAGDRAVVGVLQAGEDRQQRRLAAAVGPEDADAHAVGELEVEPVEDRGARRRTS